MSRHRKIAYLALMTTTIIWGIASPVIKYTLQFIPPFAFLFWRFLIVSIIFIPILWIYLKKKRLKLTGKKIFKMGWLGFIGTTLSLGLLFFGYQYTSAIDGSLIYSTAPIMVAVGGAIFLNEIVTRKEKLGIILAFIGSIIVIINPFVNGQAFYFQNLTGNLLVFASAVAFAVYCLLVRHTESKEKTDPLVLTAISFFVGLITVTPLFLYENLCLNNHLIPTLQSTQYLFKFNLAALPGVLYMSVFSSVIAYFTYNLGFALIEASEAAIFDYLKPVFSTPVAVLWLGEKLTFSFILGALIIAIGVFLTEQRPKLSRRSS